jgi:rare lipoprotein A (peptidoglycan hydrolase)
MTMRINARTSIALLALCASVIALGAPAASAASSGGVSVPTSTPAPASSKPKVKPTGLATWFGPGFFGKQTACGQTLTPAVIGVANRTLPCGTLVKVAYGTHTLVVPVLDRGPYANDANWDLTAGAAEALGVTETVRIHTHVVGSIPNVPTLGLPPTSLSSALAGGAEAG